MQIKLVKTVSILWILSKLKPVLNDVTCKGGVVGLRSEALFRVQKPAVPRLPLGAGTRSEHSP